MDTPEDKFQIIEEICVTVKFLPFLISFSQHKKFKKKNVASRL